MEETAGQLEPSALAPVREETPSQPTGLRIDGNKLIAVHNEIVRVTEGFNVEKLERSYAILAKVSFHINISRLMMGWGVMYFGNFLAMDIL